ncbi:MULTISPECIES: methyl-accepting chemotaxis protein [Methyloversatilis]|uniref:methyl-accepting chemotaxis protein n=1 Tax=Methyloversatilis TaxID=378210 RepID=UPI0003782418|nr:MULTISPECIES: methyl-accepting chemotaxis protein [Methyloversatilis]MCR6665072.1 methyl-accepting chemotaxis protein [Methyloversatilis sp.]PZU52929.1 MAG: methyl-accepting chemotaxis protein [Thauera sp.]
MKISTRLALIVSCSAVGLVLIGGIALSEIRSTMMAEREARIVTLLKLSTGILQRYHEQEKAGTLTREQAQAHAREALLGLQSDDHYMFARSADDVLLAHVRKEKLGQKDNGGVAPDGRTNTDVYREALAKADPAFVTVPAKKPGASEALPKMNGVTHFAPWGWTLGTGFFVDDIEQAFKSYALTLLVIALAVIAATVALTITASRRIFAQIGGEPEVAMRAATEIAAGRLDVAMPSARNGSLMHSLSIMRDSLKTMIGGIQQGSKSLTAAASDIAERMQQIREASGQSSSATSSTAAAIEEMTVSVSQIADSARDSENHSSRSAELAIVGEQRVQSAAGAIEDVSRQVTDASERIGELAERSRQISGIAKTIKEIAEQTNLLALNAAIEAARAGEQGRGFAVVADEVRKLAERTTQATGEIAQTIAAIQTDTDAVVHSMEAVRPQIQKGVALAGEAAAALRSINDGATEALHQIRSVAHATAEQTQASNSIASNVERIAHMVEESDHSVLAAEQTVHQLGALATELDSTIARFRV